MNDKPETIFDHNLTKKEALAVLGWFDLTQDRIDRYFEETHGDWLLYHLAALYEYRGDEKKMQEFLDRCEDQRAAKKFGFHYY